MPDTVWPEFSWPEIAWWVTGVLFVGAGFILLFRFVKEVKLGEQGELAGRNVGDAQEFRGVARRGRPVVGANVLFSL